MKADTRVLLIWFACCKVMHAYDTCTVAIQAMSMKLCFSLLIMIVTFAMCHSMIQNTDFDCVLCTV